MEYPNFIENCLDLSNEVIEKLVQIAITCKNSNGMSFCRPSTNMPRMLALYFEKKSTRTRLSITSAWTSLGGNVIDMSPQNGSHIGNGESLYDSFRVIAEMTDCIVVRLDNNTDFHIIKKAVQDSKRKPLLVNGLCDLFHPLQILADLMTMKESLCGNDTNISLEECLKDRTVTWIGDSNNISNELIITLHRFRCKMNVCFPSGYTVNDVIWDKVPIHSRHMVSFFVDPKKALKDADFIITDTWISMGEIQQRSGSTVYPQKVLAEMRLKDFEGFQINNELVEGSGVKLDWKFMHCLPRKEFEVSDEIFYSKKSLVFEEAANRMWTVLAAGVMEFM